MSTNDRLVMFPSRANLVLMKQRVLAAKRGMGLLKRKRDAIDMKLRDLKRQQAKTDENTDVTLRNAIFSMAKAKLLGTDLKPISVASREKSMTVLRKREQKIVGVKLYYFDLEMCSKEAFPLTGLSCGGTQVMNIRILFKDALVDLVQLASLEYMVKMLKIASRQTNMRVNALDHLVIPRYINTCNYIAGELDEFEREDFYRLKRSQAKQTEAKHAFTELIKMKQMTPEEIEEYNTRHRHASSITAPNADIHFEDISGP